MGDPYNTAPSKRDPWKGERVKADRRRKNPARPSEVVIVERRGKKVIVQRVKNPLDIMTALNAAGDIAMIKEFAGEKSHGDFTPKKKRRKNPFGKGVCPPHLKKYRFK